MHEKPHSSLTFNFMAGIVESFLSSWVNRTRTRRRDAAYERRAVLTPEWEALVHKRTLSLLSSLIIFSGFMPMICSLTLSAISSRM